MDRKVRIFDILSNNNTIKIALLAEMMDISQVTLRKDLDDLDKLGIVHRSHGYVSLDGADETSKRIAFCYSIKRRIAKAAAQVVEEGETVMLESGSCCALFAEELALAKKNITIVTNSSYIADYVYRFPTIKVILLGGYFQAESRVLIGSMVAKCAEGFYTDKFFLGTDGFIPGKAFTGKDHLRVETALGLSQYADKIFILTESAKFHRRGAYSLLPLENIDGVFTDEKIPKEAEAALTSNNVQLYKVSAGTTGVI